MSRRDAEAAEQKFRDEPPHELREITHKIIGAAIEVHRHLGPGLLESAYERALAIELELGRVPHRRQVPLAVAYKGIVVGEQRADFVVADRVVVELKAVDAIATIHVTQVVSYLKAGAFRLGLLINFNVPVLRQGVRRIVSSP